MTNYVVLRIQCEIHLYKKIIIVITHITWEGLGAKSVLICNLMTWRFDAKEEGPPTREGTIRTTRLGDHLG